MAERCRTNDENFRIFIGLEGTTKGRFHVHVRSRGFPLSAIRVLDTFLFSCRPDRFLVPGLFKNEF